MRLPKYKQHEKMGDGDPLRMAGLPMQSKGKLSKSHRNKKKRWEKKAREAGHLFSNQIGSGIPMPGLR